MGESDRVSLSAMSRGLSSGSVSVARWLVGAITRCCEDCWLPVPGAVVGLSPVPVSSVAVTRWVWRPYPALRCRTSLSSASFATPHGADSSAAVVSGSLGGALGVSERARGALLDVREPP